MLNWCYNVDYFDTSRLISGRRKWNDWYKNSTEFWETVQYILLMLNLNSTDIYLI